MPPFVKIVKGGEPWKSAYEAISGVFEGSVAGKRVLLKCSTGFDGPPKSGLSTHPEVIRGLIRFFKEQQAEVLVGDSSVIGVNTLSALKSAGIFDVCEEEGVLCIDLNASSPIEMKIENGYVVDSILFSSIVFEVDMVVSVPVTKTHMYTGVSLSIKNMKGAMYKREKNRLHRIKKALPQGASARALDYGIMDLSTVCYPDYSVIDGTVGMEGFGPSGGTPKAFGVVVASKTPIAADMIALRLMGMTLEDVGYLRLIANRKKLTYDDITVEPSCYEEYIDPFVTPAFAKLDLNCGNLEFMDESACSGCHAALTQFLRYHGNKFSDSEKITLFAGKDIREEDIKSRGGNAYLVGNCAYRFKDLAPMCKGCPPVDSEILKTIRGQNGVTVEYLGHSAFNLSTKDYRILIDPFLKNNPLASAQPEDIAATHICVTHGHDDHLGDAVEMAKATGAEVYATVELAEQKLTGLKTVAGNIGGKIKTEFGWVKFVPALHSSGVSGGVACGFLLNIEGVVVYHAGDTALSLEMKLLEKENIDIALLPIGGFYTMGPEDAVTAVQYIKPKHVVPMHYNTFLKVKQDPKAFKMLAEESGGVHVELLSPGSSFFYSE